MARFSLARNMPAAILLLAVPALALAQGTVVTRDPIPHPRFPNRITTMPLEPRYLRVYTEINDGVAVTQVNQTFYNPLHTPIEGTYVFPLPGEAAVSDFSMTMGGKTLTGEVLDKDRARATYEAIVRATRDPALLEFVDARVYQASMAPIPAHQQVEIKFEYSQALSETGGMGTFTHPLRVLSHAATPIGELVLHTRIRSNLPLTTAFCPSHPCGVSRPSDREALITYEQTQARPDRDFQVYYQRQDTPLGMALLTHRTGGEPGYFLLRIAPRVEISAGETMAKDVAFVIDTSGSMQGDKIEQAKKALKFCVNSLREQDRFSIIGFATGVHPFRDGLAAANSDAKLAGTKFIDELQAQGGTNINQALTTALAADPRDASRTYLVVFVTDGQPTVDVTDPAAILRNVGEKNAGRTRIHVLGVGSDVHTHLLDKLADAARGSHDYCTEKENLELKLSALAGRFTNPVLTDLKLDYGALTVRDAYPGVLPDLFHGGELIVLGRYEADGGFAIRLEGTLAGERKTFTVEGNFPRGQTANDFLPALWANRKVGYLLDAVRLHGANKELTDEIVRLATRFGIVTPYTSSLILEQDTVTPGLVARDERVRRFAAGQAQKAPQPAPVGGGGRSGGVAPAAPATGEGAVRASRGVAVQKDALSTLGYVGDDTDSEREDRVQLLRQVAEKTFVQVGEQYVDTAWDQQAKPQQVVAFSDEYFALLKKQPTLRQYLAISTQLIVCVDGQVYEILPPKKS